MIYSSVVEHPDVHREGCVKFMTWVYILQSEKTERYYIDSSRDVENRLKEHNSGKTISLRSQRPMKLVFKKLFPSNVDAVRMENKLKKCKNKKILDLIVKEQVIKMGL